MDRPGRRILLAVQPAVLEGALATMLTATRQDDVVHLGRTGFAPFEDGYDAAVVSEPLPDGVRAGVVITCPTPGAARSPGPSGGDASSSRSTSQARNGSWNCWRSTCLTVPSALRRVAWLQGGDASTSAHGDGAGTVMGDRQKASGRGEGCGLSLGAWDLRHLLLSLEAGRTIGLTATTSRALRRRAVAALGAVPQRPATRDLSDPTPAA